MEKIIKSINDDEINLSKVGIFYNKDNSKAKKQLTILMPYWKQKVLKQKF